MRLKYVAPHEFQQTGSTNNLYVTRKAAVIRTSIMGLKRASVQCFFKEIPRKIPNYCVMWNVYFSLVK